MEIGVTSLLFSKMSATQEFWNYLEEFIDSCFGRESCGICRSDLTDSSQEVKLISKIQYKKLLSKCLCLYPTVFVGIEEINDFPFCIDCSSKKIAKLYKIHREMESLKLQFNHMRDAIAFGIVKSFHQCILNTSTESPDGPRKIQRDFDRWRDHYVRSAGSSSNQTDSVSCAMEDSDRESLISTEEIDRNENLNVPNVVNLEKDEEHEEEQKEDEDEEQQQQHDEHEIIVGDFSAGIPNPHLSDPSNVENEIVLNSEDNRIEFECEHIVGAVINTEETQQHQHDDEEEEKEIQERLVEYKPTTANTNNDESNLQERLVEYKPTTANTNNDESNLHEEGQEQHHENEDIVTTEFETSMMMAYANDFDEEHDYQERAKLVEFKPSSSVAVNEELEERFNIDHVHNEEIHAANVEIHAANEEPQTTERIEIDSQCSIEDVSDIEDDDLPDDNTTAASSNPFSTNNEDGQVHLECTPTSIIATGMQLEREEEQHNDNIGEDEDEIDDEHHHNNEDEIDDEQLDDEDEIDDEQLDDEDEIDDDQHDDDDEDEIEEPPPDLDYNGEERMEEEEITITYESSVISSRGRKLTRKIPFTTYNSETYPRRFFRKPNLLPNHPTNSTNYLPQLNDERAPTVSGSSTACACNICFKSFPSNWKLRRHQRSHQHQQRARQKPEHRCTICSKSFPGNWKLNRHLKSHQRQAEAQVEKIKVKKVISVKPSEPERQCNICFKKFSNSSNLLRHQRLHEGQLPKPFECNVCLKSFSDKWKLARHQRIHEEGRELLVSRVTFTCDICSKSFSQNWMLARHEKSHQQSGERETSPETTTSIACTVCGKTFSDRWKLTRHIKIHQENRERVMCEICPKSFLDRWKLTRHQKIHQ